MIEFNKQSVPVIEALFPIVLEKYRLLVEDLDRYACGDKTFAAVDDVPVVVPAHIDSEKSSMVKQYLLFLQSIAIYDCTPVFYSSVMTLANLNAIFNQLFYVLTKDDVEIFTASTLSNSPNVNPAKKSTITTVTMLSLRKNVCYILSGLSKVWLDSSSNADIPKPPNATVVWFRDILLQQFMPVLIASCYHKQALNFTPVQRINASDAQGIALIADIGGLIHILTLQQGHDFITYLQYSLLPGLQWPIEQTTELCTYLRTCQQEQVAVGILKEYYKKVIKTLVSLK